ncbi:hypothetical protein J7384_00170 [Endozoicomonas sp. G2_1]|uniref:hypothetical protein n=1 Tax=Endozoicomonas sp. G2_1 TaxID=2821091 RepID=UPI001ADCD1F2|nr:hypothetical protein [Endozoicomonas sp. G2_1]MBO9488773.1 hypothetical protein [Endozoicomonas sp. G2_1]
MIYIIRLLQHTMSLVFVGFAILLMLAPLFLELSITQMFIYWPLMLISASVTYLFADHQMNKSLQHQLQNQTSNASTNKFKLAAYCPLSCQR